MSAASREEPSSLPARKELVEASGPRRPSACARFCSTSSRNALGTGDVVATIDIVAAIIAESTLSFRPGFLRRADLGSKGATRSDYLDIAPHWALFPGGLIFITVLAINFIGDGLRDAPDPRRAPSGRGACPNPSARYLGPEDLV